MTLWALHGFLGQASDWEFLRKPLKKKGVFLQAVDLSTEENLSARAFWDWAETFNTQVRKKKGPHYLLGYSMGGRLALHALLADQNLWKGAIVVAAHPGLIGEDEKRARAKRDLEWTKAFASEPWDQVLDAWNAQPIFAESSADLVRREKDFSRQKIVKQMKTWSLARQENLRPYLRGLNTPLLWILGQTDRKFRDLAKEAQGENENIQVAVVDEAGHRVPWDQSERFLHLVEGVFAV